MPIVGQNGIGMFGAMLLNMVNRLVQVFNNFYAQDKGQPFLIKILWPSGQDSGPVRMVFQNSLCLSRSPKFNLVLGQTRGRER